MGKQVKVDRALAGLVQNGAAFDRPFVGDTADVLSRDPLRQIYLNEEPVMAVAVGLGISRFSLNRRIAIFCSNWRLAA